jgi:hypothetical protein
MFLIVSLSPAMAAPEPVPNEDVDPQVINEGGVIPAQVTPYYVMAATGNAVAQGTLSPAALEHNDTLAEITVPGPTFPRRTLTRAGVFTMHVSQAMPLEVLGIQHVSVWAKSNEDVTNARFRILFQRNGNTRANMNTQTMGLNNVPLEFTVSDAPSFVEPEIFQRGDRLSIEIQYTAASRRVVGPAPGCILLSSNTAHPTRIELLARPIDTNVTTPIFLDNLLHITGKVIDTSEVDPKTDLLINLDIVPSSGTIRPDSIVKMNFLNKETEYLINWTWDYTTGEYVDGLFEFRIDVSYGVIGHNYTNSTFVELTFPKEKKQGATLTTTQIGVIAGLAAVAAVVAIVLVIKQRSSTPRGYPPGYGPRPKPKKAKKPKLTRAEKAARKKAKKKGLPPPARGPPSPDRTPMPGRAPPGARRHPTKVPGRPQGAPPTGSARPRRR